MVAALPSLPFDDGAFRLVLSAYLLFAYPDHLDEAAHEQALREAGARRAGRWRLFLSSTPPTCATPRSATCAGASRRGVDSEVADRLRASARWEEGAGPQAAAALSSFR